MPKQIPSSFSIGVLSKSTSVNVETIRYYERIGLTPRPPRTAAGQRVYGEADRKRLDFVRRCRELGFSLEDIRALLDLAEREDRTCRDVKEKTVTHLLAIRRKIADLKRMEAVLKDLATSCDGGNDADCPILETLSG
ncbi:MAG: helix-turn-helix domain-containing protein [Sphingomonadales bacterium]